MAAIYGGDEVNAVVLDLGTWQTKAGYAGDDTPKAVFPSVAGVVAGDANGMDVDGEQQQQQPGGSRKLYLGSQDVSFRRQHMEVASPFSADGLLSDWEMVQSIWKHALKDRLMADPAENAVLLAEPTHNTREARERTVQAAFESLSCPALYLAKDAVLATFSVAKQTSVVVDAGHSATTVAAVHDGYVLTKSVSRSPVGGRLLNDAMRCALGELMAKEGSGAAQLRPRNTFKRIGRSSKGAGDAWEIVDLPADEVTPSWLEHQAQLLLADVKESVCRVNDVHFVEADNETVPAVTYELPDGQEVYVGKDRFKVPELLFQPTLVRSFPGLPADVLPPEGVPGLAGLVVESVNRCDADVRKDLYQHVVLAGGTSLVTQMRERLEQDISAAAPGGTKVKVTAPVNPTERRHAVWIGGSILASLGSFQQMWMSRQEYEEHGPGLIHRKAP